MCLFWNWFREVVSSVQFSCSVVSDSLRPHGLTAAWQASLSITNSWSLLKLMSIESGMLSSHFILCCPLLLLPSMFPSIRVCGSLKKRKKKICYVLTLASSFSVCFHFIDWTDSSRNLSGNLLGRMDVTLSSRRVEVSISSGKPQWSHLPNWSHPIL